MGLIETEAIILRTYNLAEADKIVICLTRKAGVIRGVARGSRRLKSRFGAGLEPFTLVALSYHEKEGRELVALRQAEIISSYFNLCSDALMVSSLARMAEMVIEFSPPHEPNERVFRMVSACLEAISRSPASLEELLGYFEVWLLRLSGFLPDITRCSVCGSSLRDSVAVFMDAEGRLRCRQCSPGALGASLSEEVLGRLRAIRRLSPDAYALEGLKGSAESRKELDRLTSIIIRRALERELRAKPLVLQS
ncbi:MAG: DNA repair protein RecO [Acidobacteria bacterium 13_1_20CM_3_53_8]|nr:MAG: DNA repair protein RecO [Acidobacteria bacterium 13_1_20CM_3_53_8]